MLVSIHSWLPCKRGQVGLLLAASATFALAQTPPDAGRILQEVRPQPPAPSSDALPPILTPTQPAQALPAGSGDARVQVSRFDFVGNSVISVEDLRATMAPWLGRQLSFGELIEAVDAVEARYKQAGYFLAYASLPPQKIKDGVIEIIVSEGRLAQTRLEGESRVAPDVLYRYLDRLPVGEPLILAKLERQVLLINELAGGQASLDLQAGDKPGSTDVVLVQKADNVLAGRLEANNHGLPSTGQNRLGLTLNTNSLFQQGERISLSALSSSNSGLVTYNLRGDLPVGGDGWRLSAAASRATYQLGGAFQSLDTSGTADAVRLGASYPLVRARGANVRLQAELDQSKLVDKFGATNTQFDKQSRGVTLTASADGQDEFMGGGSSRADLIVRTGQLDLGSAAAAQDAPGTAGHFSKATLTAQRHQNLSRDVSMRAQFFWQLASKNLDSSEKLSLGGPTTLPGYANGEASGDSGTLLKLALRWQAQPQFVLTAFADFGRLRLAHDPLPATNNHKRLSDVGVGADWLMGKNLSVNAMAAWAGSEAPNPADNAKPRLWLSLGYAW